MAPKKGCTPWNKGKKCPEVSERMKGNKLCLNRVVSEETRKKLSISNTGKKHSEATKNKISQNNAMKGKTGELHHFFGKHHTMESKEKSSKSHLGKICSEETKKKMSLAWDYNKIITPERNSKISKALKGKSKSLEHCKNIGLSKKGIFSGDKHPNWRGGTSSYQGGYIYEFFEGKYQLQHRLVMERYLGRKLLKTEVVHHKDKNRKNNDIDNLELWDRKEHQKMHVIEYWRTIQCSIS
jgi:hypothetical protein